MTAEEFARKIKVYRKLNGLTQGQAAEFFGLSVRTWQNWEIARNMPRGYGLISLLAMLEKSGPGKKSPGTKKRQKSQGVTPPRRVEPVREEEEGLATHLL